MNFIKDELIQFTDSLEIEFADLIKGSKVIDIGRHKNSIDFIIDLEKDNKKFRASFGVNKFNKIYVSKAVNIKNPSAESLLGDKIKNFSEREHNGEFNDEEILLQEDPINKKFLLVYKGQEIISLTISEIKMLPEHIRKQFSKVAKNKSEILLNLLTYGHSI